MQKNVQKYLYMCAKIYVCRYQYILLPLSCIIPFFDISEYNEYIYIYMSPYNMSHGCDSPDVKSSPLADAQEAMVMLGELSLDELESW